MAQVNDNNAASRLLRRDDAETAPGQPALSHAPAEEPAIIEARQHDDGLFAEDAVGQAETFPVEEAQAIVDAIVMGQDSGELVRADGTRADATAVMAAIGSLIDRRSMLQALALIAFCFSFSRLSIPEAFAKKAPKRYRVVYKLNGGKNPSGQVRTIRRGRTISIKKIKNPKRKGYQFVDWYRDKSLKKRAKRVAGHKRTSKRTLYAKWKIKTYKIKYVLDGGTPTLPLPKKYTVKTDTIEPFPPTKDGYRFAGWYSDAAFTSVRKKIAKGSTGTVTLYAKWKPTTYWNAHLREKCDQVNEIVESIGRPMPSFVFITDMHIPNNALVSPDLVKRVINETGAEMVMFGGDAINYCMDPNDAVDTLGFVKGAFGPADVHFVRGNHDTNYETWRRTTQRRLSNETYIEATACDNEVRKNDKLYYYFDDERFNLRYISMDSCAPNSGCMTETQVNWMKNRILELDESWTVLVFVHQFFKGAVNDGGTIRCTYDNNGKLVKAALDEIHDEAAAKIAGVFSGHIHSDFSKMSKKGYPMIATTCDAVGSNKTSVNGERKAGTTSEQVFDVVVLDMENEKVHLTRVGAGEDRVFSYGKPVEPDPDDPENPQDPVDPVDPVDPENPQDPQDGQEDSSTLPFQAS